MIRIVPGATDQRGSWGGNPVHLEDPGWKRPVYKWKIFHLFHPEKAPAVDAACSAFEHAVT